VTTKSGASITHTAAGQPFSCGRPGAVVDGRKIVAPKYERRYERSDHDDRRARHDRGGEIGERPVTRTHPSSAAVNTAPWRYSGSFAVSGSGLLILRQRLMGRTGRWDEGRAQLPSGRHDECVADRRSGSAFRDRVCASIDGVPLSPRCRSCHVDRTGPFAALVAERTVFGDAKKANKASWIPSDGLRVTAVKSRQRQRGDRTTRRSR
jgi:hypothetical protein